MADQTAAGASSASARALQVISDHVHHNPSGGSWKSQPELPGKDELCQGAEPHDLPRNPVDRPWASKEAYLEAQYKILRMEGTEGLRASVGHFRADPEMADDSLSCVYREVHVRGYLATATGPVCRLEFSPACRIEWQLSRRLTPGTIVALTTASDNFNTVCKVATVAQRPIRGMLDQDPPMIDIYWADPCDAALDPEDEMVMIESRVGYYESIRHVLVGLQHTANTNSPLDKYLVGSHTGEAAPASYSADCPPAATSHTSLLDESQRNALRRILSKELAVVQGPPGTGKTFTSVAALTALVANRKPSDPPIVVSAQANHALDQLLVQCFDAGAKIVRLGGRSKDEVVAAHTLHNLRKKTAVKPDPTSRNLEALRQKLVSELQGLVRSVFPDQPVDPTVLLDEAIISQAQFDSILKYEWDSAEVDHAKAIGSIYDWLEGVVAPKVPGKKTSMGQLQEDPDSECEIDSVQDGVIDDDDKARLQGIWIPISRKWQVVSGTFTEQAKAEAEDSLATNSDMSRIPIWVRGNVYRLLQAKLLDAAQPRFIQLLVEMVRVCKDLKVGRTLHSLKVVRKKSVDIVGCTTTGLTKYRAFLAAMQPRMLYIEEAAETREANIVSALVPSVQQLVLVGDHQQLRPSCDIRRLGGAPYNLNVSMFERLVGLGLPYTMLNQQRRMRLELRHVLQPFYPDLADHPSVHERPPVRGMGGNDCGFFHFDWPEESDANSSVVNKKEAQMVAKFFAYLVQNGISSARITVLTFYNGQRKEITRRLREERAIGASENPTYNVCTVDSYQGEENDIVILSLVRSPAPGRQQNVGFLKEKNRVMVAISRARCGFYIFGNSTNVMGADPDESRDVWTKVWNGFAEQRRVFRGAIEAACQNHGSQVRFSKPGDFVDNAGGCTVRCGDTLRCGHTCQLRCHTTPHEKQRCPVPCQVFLDCGHKCIRKCTDKCFCSCIRFQLTTDAALAALKKSQGAMVPHVRKMEAEKRGQWKILDIWHPTAATEDGRRVSLRKSDKVEHTFNVGSGCSGGNAPAQGASSDHTANQLTKSGDPYEASDGEESDGGYGFDAEVSRYLLRRAAQALQPDHTGTTVAQADQQPELLAGHTALQPMQPSDSFDLLSCFEVLQPTELSPESSGSTTPQSKPQSDLSPSEELWWAHESGVQCHPSQ